jgi:hypothetical protein
MTHTYTPEELASLASRHGAKSITVTGPDISNDKPSEGEPAFLLYSHKHAAWWAPARAGYTGALDEAGRYIEDEARWACEKSARSWRDGQLPPTVMVRADSADLAAAVKAATETAIADRAAAARIAALLHTEITDLATLNLLPLGAGVVGGGYLWQRCPEGGHDGGWYGTEGEAGFILSADLLAYYGPVLFIWAPVEVASR